MNISHYARRIFFIALHAAVSAAGFGASSLLIRVVLSFLVFLSYDARQVITSVIAATLMGVIIFFSARTQGIQDTTKRHYHPIVTVVANVAASAAVFYALYTYTAGMEEPLLSLLQIILISLSFPIGDTVGYLVGHAITKSAYEGYIVPADDAPIERPSKTKSWRDTVTDE